METKRGRGRPAGSKDTRARVYRRMTLETDGADLRGGMLSVEDHIRKLKHPVRVSTLAEISGLSEATLRKKIMQGKIKAFKRSGIVLVEPKCFLEYWLGGVGIKPIVNDPRLFDRRPMNVN
jgi:hypothetical protein